MLHPMRSGVAAAVAAGAVLFAPAPARAGDGDQAPPQPACSAAVLADARGDTENAGLDLVGVFLTEFLGDTFANVVVADLDRTVEEPDSTQEYFRLRYRDDAGRTQTRWARMYADGSRDGGTWFDGPDGVVQIRMPSLTPGTPTALEVRSGGERTVGTKVPEHFHVAVTPFTSVADELTAGTRTGTGPPQPVKTAPAWAGASDEPAGPQVTVGTLRLRGRTLRIPLRSTARVTDISGRLTSGGRVVARGRLAELDGRGVLVLTARRGFRPGTYRLTIPGVIERRVRIA